MAHLSRLDPTFEDRASYQLRLMFANRAGGCDWDTSGWADRLILLVLPLNKGRFRPIARHLPPGASSRPALGAGLVNHQSGFVQKKSGPRDQEFA
jgi:hypothetical protein